MGVSRNFLGAFVFCSLAIFSSIIIKQLSIMLTSISQVDDLPWFNLQASRGPAVLEAVVRARAASLWEA
jgi:hypothetical protein